MAKIKIADELFEKVKAAAVKAGYASPEEFITHALEKATAADASTDEQAQAKEKLKGLGYIG